MHHRRLEALAQSEQLRMGPLAAGSAKDRDAPIAVQHRGEAVDLRLRRRHDRSGRQQAGDLRRWTVRGCLERHVAWHDDHGDASLAHCFSDRDFKDSRHLMSTRDQFAIVTALFEKSLWMGLLKIARADLRRWDLRRDAKYRHARAMAVEEAIDQVQISGTATASANRECVCQVRLSAGCERGDFFMPDMNPLDLALPTDGIG